MTTKLRFVMAVLGATFAYTADLRAQAAAPPEPTAAPPVVEVKPDPEPPPARNALEVVDVKALPLEASADAPSGDNSEQATSPDALTGAVGAGSGIGERVVRMPTPLGLRRLGTEEFPVLDLDLHADIVLRRHIVLGAAIHYQTSVGLHGGDLPPDRLVANDAALRAARVEFGATPGYRFSRKPGGVILRAFLGWSFRGLRAITEVGLPSYTLHGPVLRPTLQIPLFDNRIVIGIAPEIVGVVGVSGSLRNAANTSAAGVGVGGEASVDVLACTPLHLVVAYRESHARLQTAGSGWFMDIERFGTVRAVLQY